MTSTAAVRPSHQAGWWHSLWHHQLRQQQQQQQPAGGCKLDMSSTLEVDEQRGGRRRMWRRRASAPVAGLLRCAWSLKQPVLAVAGFLSTATACAFLPPVLTIPLGAAALASRGWPPWPTRPPRTAHAAWLQPFQRLRGPAIVLTAMRLVLPPTLPAVWRALQYWQRSVPILARFLTTRAKANRLQRRGRHTEAQALWQWRHQAAANEIFDMLADIQGFYVKLAQILATKTDMLPGVYTSSLQRLMDRLPPAPWAQVKRVLERELRRPVHELFVDIDTVPIASATVAQVHVGQLRSRSGDAHVAVKVQHRGVRGMMQADLANMRLFVDLCDLLHISLGFDLGSVVREYQVVVPDEFRFDREAAAMAAVRESLQRHAREEDLADLRHVIVPAAYQELSTERVLVMQLLEGVPLLHASGMSQHIRTSLLQALVLSYGVQILVDGLFHTDPHPGNLLACIDELGDVAIGICDFGQVKRLTPDERERYARLVVALASRDNSFIRQTCKELGVRIENCGPDFEETAAYILFDTRMDIPEALQSPLAPDSHPGWRTTRVPALPRDLFFIMRVITLLRGVLASMQCLTVSSALLWEPIARKVLKEARATRQAAEEAQQQLKAQRDHHRTLLQSHPLTDVAGSLKPDELSASTGSLDAGQVTLDAGLDASPTRTPSSGWDKFIAAVPRSNEPSLSGLNDDLSLAGMGRASAEGTQAHSACSGVRHPESTEMPDVDVLWWDEGEQDEEDRATPGFNTTGVSLSKGLAS